MNMKISTVFLLLGMALSGHAAGPLPVCDEPVFHFGTIDPSAAVTNVFLIRNDGDTTFIAGTIRTGCSCTKARISRRMIGPGETAELTVVFSAARRRGPQKRAAYLLAEDTSEPVLVFFMEGFVEPAEVDGKGLRREP